MGTVRLVIPDQSKWRVSEQRYLACQTCAEYFILKAQIGYTIDFDGHMPCECHYAGICEDLKGEAAATQGAVAPTRKTLTAEERIERMEEATDIRLEAESRLYDPEPGGAF